MRLDSIAVFFFAFLWLMPCAFAHGLLIKAGPVSFGNGGSNPIGIPPKSADYELTYVHNDLEISLGLPALSVGWKILRQDWGGYLAAGPALVAATSGGGPGGYVAYGYQSSQNGFVFVAEYKAYLAVVSSGFTQPYSMRIGVGYIF